MLGSTPYGLFSWPPATDSPSSWDTRRGITSLDVISACFGKYRAASAIVPAGSFFLPGRCKSYHVTLASDKSANTSTLKVAVPTNSSMIALVLNTSTKSLVSAFSISTSIASFQIGSGVSFSSTLVR